MDDDILFVGVLAKKQVEKSLPPRLETKIVCPLTEMQVFWYKRLLLKESEAMIRYEEQQEGAPSAADYRRLAALLVQLRKACNHPFLFEGAEQPGCDLHDIIEASGKLKVRVT